MAPGSYAVDPPEWTIVAGAFETLFGAFVARGLFQVASDSAPLTIRASCEMSATRAVMSVTMVMPFLGFGPAAKPISGPLFPLNDMPSKSCNCSSTTKSSAKATAIQSLTSVVNLNFRQMRGRPLLVFRAVVWSPPAIAKNKDPCRKLWETSIMAEVMRQLFEELLIHNSDMIGLLLRSILAM